MALPFLKKKEKEQPKSNKQDYNPYLLAAIQPQGGVKFEESYIRKGDGYEACIHVYDTTRNVNDFWLHEIMNISNVITTLDTISQDKHDVVEAINKSMSEQSSRFDGARDNSERIDAKEQYRELESLYHDLKDGEVMKLMHLRIYISGKTIFDLEKQAKMVMDHLSTLNFKGAIFLNEQEYEWDSLITSFDMQSKYVNSRRGKEVPALALAGGYPFHFTQLNDPYGTYYGTTETRGSVIFDLFHKDKRRKSYNAVLLGLMGAGKSTLLKKITVDNASKGYKIRGFDIVGEFIGVVEEKLNGRMIALDGSDGIINPLQVYKTAEREDISFTQHLSKLTTFYRFIAPQAGDDELKEYENLLRRLYIKMGLWDDQKGEENHLTGLPVDKYPIFSDFLKFVRSELYEDVEQRKHHDNLGESRKHRLELIELNIVNLVETYSKLFNGVSTIADFNEEQVVFFSLRHLSSFKTEIFQAQIFNVMNLLWDGMLQNGSKQLENFNKGILDFEDAVRYLIIIDEAHHIINTRKESEHAVRFLTKFSREARKYFAGLMFASHSIRDFVPENSDQGKVEEIKKLFELTQYKFVMEQDNNSLQVLENVFGGQLTESELSKIPNLETGQVVMSIRSVQNILFNVEVTQEELTIFGGGA